MQTSGRTILFCAYSTTSKTTCRIKPAQNQTGHIEDVRVVMIPSKMQSCYQGDFEWAYNDNADGEVFKPGYYDDASLKLCTNIWETELQQSQTPTTNSDGHFYCQPWEAWYGTPTETPPVPFPLGFHRARFLAWDRKPVEYITLKDLQDRDNTWKTRQGDPLYYWRDSEVSNRHYLYPMPSSETWTDQDNEDADPDEAAYASTSLDVDDNLIVIFDKTATDLSDDTDSSVFAAFLHKYIEYGTLARAYGANTDGRIRSLAEYWELRKKVGIKAIKIYQSKKNVDRNYCLQTKGARPIRSTRHPRLPSTYPNI
jgi:hypothetical protein